VAQPPIAVPHKPVSYSFKVEQAMADNPLRNLPSVDQLLQHPLLQQFATQASRTAVVQKVRSVLDDVRAAVSAAAEETHVPSPQEIIETVAGWMKSEQSQRLRPVINATGVLLHTGLGRAPLAKVAIEEIARLNERYCSLEFNLQDGSRGKRTAAIEGLLCELTGAEAATVVNNNAAATMLTLAALCAGKEVIVSRGQLVEIGGSYRLPDVMESAGCRLVEVGTTNKTRISDYKNAITENTAGILRVHPSNFLVYGFTESASLSELAKLSSSSHLPLIDDIGSGALIDFKKFGLNDEPLVWDSVKGGATVSLFSGDKLLGGPQCGIIAGRKAEVAKIIKHPMMRAFRVGKLTLMALQATLELYRNPPHAMEQIPLLRMLGTTSENLQLRAKRLVQQLTGNPFVSEVSISESKATLGGGSIPTQVLPSVSVAIKPQDISVDELANRLRSGEVSVVGRVNEGRLLLDLKTVHVNEDRQIIDAFLSLQHATGHQNTHPKGTSGTV